MRNDSSSHSSQHFSVVSTGSAFSTGVAISLGSAWLNWLGWLAGFDFHRGGLFIVALASLLVIVHSIAIVSFLFG